MALLRRVAVLCTSSAVLRCDVFRRSLYYGWMMFSSIMGVEFGTGSQLVKMGGYRSEDMGKVSNLG